METKQHKTELTAAEISNLWTSYQNDTMAMCGIQYFLQNIDSDEIRSVLEYALKISKEHVQFVKQKFQQENYPLPQGFTEKDVNLEAPRLFTDKMYLLYILNMGKFGLTSYSLALSFTSRDDMIKFYSQCLDETKILHNQAKELAKKKGLYTRAPEIPKPEQIDFVSKDDFLAGYVGDRRPLLGVEIANLVYNAKRNALGQALITGFSQVARNKEVRKYFEQGRDISGKHFEIFSSILNENYLSQGTMNMTSEVTDSTVPPFSDKLMMYHIAALIASGIGQYGVAMSTSPRHDLGVTYGRLILELGKFTNKGANLMINHSWMEQPPRAADRKALARRS